VMTASSSTPVTTLVPMTWAVRRSSGARRLELGLEWVHSAGHGAWAPGPVVDELQRRGVTIDAVEPPRTGFFDDRCSSGGRNAGEPAKPNFLQPFECLARVSMWWAP
jgi:hypothetical protein